MNHVLMLVRDAAVLTKAAVESVLEQDIPVELLVISQASKDGVNEWLRTKHPRLKLITCSPARSVSAGWNLGLKHLFRKVGCESVLVVNNDVVLRPDTYRELLADGGQFVTAVGVDSLEQIQTTFTKAVRPNPDFSCWLIRKQAWEKVGGFDENFKGAYGEDWDMHVRLHRAGIPAYTIGLPFYHCASGTLKSVSEEEREAICRQADVNREYFFQKYGIRGGTAEYYSLFS